MIHIIACIVGLAFTYFYGLMAYAEFGGYQGKHR